MELLKGASKIDPRGWNDAPKIFPFLILSFRPRNISQTVRKGGKRGDMEEEI